MSGTNPYQTPSAEVGQQSQSGELGEPQGVPAGNGTAWLGTGFNLFKANIGLWIGMVVVYFVILIVLSMIPLVNFLVGLITPLFTAGFMVAASRADNEGNFEFGDMFAGFREQTGPLIILGLIYLGFIILLSIVMVGLVFAVGAGSAMSGDPEAMGAMGPGFMLVILIGMALFIPLAMAMWFSPALIILNKLGAWEAFKLSMRGCLKNIIPFLVYGIVVLVLAIVASIPIFLGWLVLGPMLLGSIYAGYKDIFIQA